METNDKVPKYVKCLDDLTIMQIAETYPEEMRESFIWFARFVRDNCHKNLDVLVTRMRGCGYTTTPTTYSRILQGNWNRTAEGQPCSPIMAMSNFLSQVDRLRKKVNLDRLAGRIPFIETETYRDLRDYISVRMAADAVCKFGLIIGQTGSMKTATFKHLADVIFPGIVIHVEAPDTPSMNKFIKDVAEKFGVSRHASHAFQQQSIRENMMRGITLIIDNVQRLYKEGKGWNQPIFNYIQKLQDETNCTIILCAVPEFEMKLLHGRERGYFEQFEGRCGGRDEFFIMEDFTPREDIIQIAEAVKIGTDKKTIDFMEHLVQRPGRIRILFNYLQRAKRAAEAAGEKLKLAHLIKAAGKAGLQEGAE